jgi:hypothetical protein
MTPEAPALTTPAASAVSPSLLSSINPQQMLQAAVMNDITNTGGRNVSSIVQGMSTAQPNQSAIGNRTALQALGGYQQALSGQGGTGGLGGFAKEAEAKGGGLLGTLGGGLAGAAGGAAAGASLGTLALPGIGTIGGGLLGLLGGGLGAMLGSKAGGAAGNYISGKTGPGQFEALRQSTAAQIAAGSGMDPGTVLSYLPDYGENPQTSQTKLSTLQTMLSSGYSGAVNPAQLNPSSQQSFGGVGLNSLPNINAGTGATSPDVSAERAASAATAGTGATTAGTSLADLPEEALSMIH